MTLTREKAEEFINKCHAVMGLGDNISTDDLCLFNRAEGFLEGVRATEEMVKELEKSLDQLAKHECDCRCDCCSMSVIIGIEEALAKWRGEK